LPAPSRLYGQALGEEQVEYVLRSFFHLYKERFAYVVTGVSHDEASALLFQRHKAKQPKAMMPDRPSMAPTEKPR
jgi:hypothetical protein